MLLHFVRHGQTDLNLSGELQGNRSDEPINETGIKQVQKLLEVLPDFSVIYSSPLQRVKMTADIIATYTGKPILITSEITERDFGSIAGKKWVDISNGLELQAMDRDQKYNYRPYGGESVQEVTERLNNFFTKIKESGHMSVLAVSSIGIIRLAYHVLLGERIVEVKNASIHTFTL